MSKAYAASTADPGAIIGQVLSFGIGGVIIVVLAFILLASAIFVVPQQSAYIIERLGKFHRIAHAGIHVKIPFIDRVAAKMDLRVTQLTNSITTKTKDDTFVSLSAAVQYRIDKNKIYDAFYELSSPQDQIRSYIEDSVRNSVPEITLDATFSQKDEIATNVGATLEEKMSQFGYEIISTLITDIKPDQSVVDAMNAINEAQRKRQAAQDLAEADKIVVVTRAEAQKEEMRLQGEGVAAQRKAIIDGLKESVNELSETGMTPAEVMSVILANQYIDVMDEFAQSNNTKVIFADSSPSGIDNVRNDIMSALEASNGNIAAATASER